MANHSLLLTKLVITAKTPINSAMGRISSTDINVLSPTILNMSFVAIFPATTSVNEFPNLVVKKIAIRAMISRTEVSKIFLYNKLLKINGLYP